VRLFLSNYFDLLFQDEADHKDDGDEEHVDLVKKAEEDFFECIEAEKMRRERDMSRKDLGLNDEDEKQDKGKVRFFSIIFHIRQVHKLTLTEAVVMAQNLPLIKSKSLKTLL